MDIVNIFTSELRNKVRVECGLAPGSWVEFYDDLLIQTIYRQGNKSENPKENIDNNLQTLIECISDWNFADEKGKLPLTVVTLKRLPMKLLNWLTEKSSECLTTTNKKKE